eukprot:COSAG02_NODE_1342_length_13169_cov_11.075905_4_plen_73_part_00
MWTVHVAVQWREELRSLRRLAAAAAMEENTMVHIMLLDFVVLSDQASEYTYLSSPILTVMFEVKCRNELNYI